MDRVQSPYVGLVPYREADAQFFFGRERDQRRVIAQMFAARLTLLYGASGVGKSSLLRAGVVTELRRRAAAAAEEGEKPDVLVVYFNEWQGDPVAAFREAVSRSVGPLLAPGALAAVLDRSTLTDIVTALVAALDTDLFLVFDQFEEFFLYHARPGEPSSFERDFATLATKPGLPVSVVISLRDDALSRLDHFKALIPNLFANYVRVEHLSPDDAQRAIEEPIRAFNALPSDQRAWDATVSIEPALVEAVIDGVRTGRVAVGDLGRGQTAVAQAGVETPYLQLVMTELWRYEHETGSTTLRAATLARLGGAEAIVQRHLDTTLAALSDADRDTCARMFQYLVTPTGTKIAYTSDDLAGLAERPAREIELVLSALSGSGMRILSPVAPPTDRPGPIRYEIYHDSLAQAILDWRRRYVAQREKAELEKQRAEQERELQDELAHQRSKREQAQKVADAERARAEAESLRVVEQQAAARRFKRVAAAALLLAVGAIAAAGYAWVERSKAEFMSGKAVAAEAQASQIQADARKVATEQGTLIAQLQGRLDSANKSLGKVDDAETQRLRAEAAAYKEQLAKLNTQASQIQRPTQDDRPAALQRELDVANKRINELEADSQALKQAQATIARLQEDVKRLDGENQALRAESQVLRAENARLKADPGKGGGDTTKPGPSVDTTPSVPAGDYREIYRNAILAKNKQQWSIAASLLRSAIALHGKETGERINISGFGNIEPYVPQYYLGMCLKRSGDCAGALQAWEASERDGAIKTTSLYKSLQQERADCQAK